MANTSSVLFDGIDGRIAVAHNNFSGLATGTIEFWFKTNYDTTFQKMVFKEGCIDIGLTQNFGGGAKVFAEINGIANLGEVEEHDYADDAYHHFAITWDGSWLRAYVDGVYKKKTAQSSNQNNDANALYIGRRITTEPFTGNIDEFRISNIARYTTETSFTPQVADFTDDANTLVLLHLNDGSGTNANDETGDNDGTLSGGASWSSTVPYTGPTSTNDERDAHLIGKDSANSTRATTLLGKDTANSSRSARLAGGIYSTDRTTGGTASASAENLPDEGVAKAFDDTDSTKWLAFVFGPHWIKYDFGSGVTRKIQRYSIVSGNDAPERDPVSWILQGSNDDSAWTDLHTVTSYPGWSSRNQLKDFEFPNDTHYRYIRLYVTAIGSGEIIQLSELRLYELYDITSSERAATLLGKDTANATRGAHATGKDTGIDNRNAIVTGTDSTSGNRGAITIGKESANDNKSAHITGKDTSSDSRPAKIHGTDIAVSQINAHLWGKDTSFSEHGATLIGFATDNSSRSAVITGKLNRGRPTVMSNNLPATIIGPGRSATIL